MLQTICYHALKTYYRVHQALGLMSRNEYERAKRLLKQNFLPKPEIYTITRIGFVNWWVKKHFDSYFAQNKQILQDKYLRLIDGLDDESLRTIQMIISRLMRYYQSGGSSRKLRFETTVSEKRILDEIQEKLYSKIIKFPNGITAYKKWLLPDHDDFIFEAGVFYSKHFIEEIDNLNKFKDKEIIDVGAYIGDSALVLQDFTDKKVYAFEPSHSYFEKMTETIKLNNSSKIIPVPLGLGDKTEELIMEGSFMMGATDASVKITTLDEWIRNNNVEVGIIKVDVEGFEQKVLRGALETIQKYKPALLISIYHSASDMFEIKPFLESLNLGYKFKIRRPQDVSVLNDTMLICEVR